MIEEKSKTFEEIFNEWYKKFLAEEAGMNNEIKNAKKYREEKLNQARKEAMIRIQSYEDEQRDKLESDKEKLNVTKNYFDQMDADYKKEVETMKSQLKQNKNKVIDFLIGNVLNVELDLPKSVMKDSNEKIGKKILKALENIQT